ncbi:MULTISPECIES: pep a2 [Streptomyces]|uniref:pep a2 n=1 Tax=Streptomyces TaxID=1883 RepID=UPI00210D7CA0|nr:pep a2 [Streptomyces longispororuber]MCQ4214015.1 pep a2 [Streptomyces longispororuber]
MNRTVPRYYHVEVDPEPERVGQVQRIVAAHLRYWGLEKLATPATRGVGLLMEAAAGGGPVTIETWWTGQHLITAVSHQDATEAGQGSAPLACLRRIAALSDGWGSCTAHARRIVWFSLRSRNNVREPLAPKRPVPSTGAARQVPRTVPAPSDRDVPLTAGAVS